MTPHAPLGGVIAKRGPKTEKGKARVRRNAVRHGILSPAPIITGLESEADWWRHHDGIFQSLEPQGHLEEVLTERIASILWRLRRAQYHETLMIEVSHHGIPENLAITEAYRRGIGMRPKTEEQHLQDADDAVSRLLIPPEYVLNKVMRYESHLHRLFLQTLHELEALQTRRQGGVSHLARLDVSVPPPG